MAKVIIDEATLTDIGNAIREQEGSTALIPTSDIASRIRALTSGGSGGGNTDIEDALITKTIVEYTNDRITNLPTYCFAYFENLISVSLPNVVNNGVGVTSKYGIGQYAFSDCTKLKNVFLPKAYQVGMYAFNNCSSLEEIYLPAYNCSEPFVFTRCTSLRIISMPKMHSLATRLFLNCSSLSDVYLGYDNVVKVNTDTFNGCPTGIKVHVRAEYADQYATATNWSALIEAGTIVIVGDYSD